MKIKIDTRIKSTSLCYENSNDNCPVNIKTKFPTSLLRSAAEERTDNVALLSREADKLTELLVEIGARKLLTKNLSMQSTEELFNC